ncbi:hypothetical protein [Halalkalibacter alkaliphilus]|nr:hypothetical protein [Halalkalibacter alkaliphilus]
MTITVDYNHAKAVRYNWYPGKNHTTEQDRLGVIKELKRKE